VIGCADKKETELKLFAAFFLSFALLAAAGPARADNLYESLSRKSSVRVFVETPKDATGKDKVLVQELQKAFEEALASRKSIHFAANSSVADADLVVSTTVSELYWTDHDPVDMIAGLGATAMDAALVEDYVRMQAQVTVKDGRTGGVLWSDKLMATITKKPMSEEESYHLINGDMAREFVKQAFAKKRQR
jgi:hypothetical protein